jgi:membrane-associated protein
MVLDLLTVVGPLMTSPVLYPLLTGLSSLDGVLPMVPSEAAVVTAGVFSHTGTPNLWVVVVATALGVFAGDHLAYGLSRSVFGPRLISRSKHVSQAVGAASRQLDRRAGLLIVTSRFLPGGRVTMNAACGTARLPLSRFSPASAVAALAWAAYMAGIGFLGGAAFVENPLLALAVGIGLSIGLGSVIELIRRRVGIGRPRQQAAARPAATVGIAGATPTPSADTHATARPVAASQAFEEIFQDQPRPVGDWLLRENICAQRNDLVRAVEVQVFYEEADVVGVATPGSEDLHCQQVLRRRRPDSQTWMVENARCVGVLAAGDICAGLLIQPPLR